MQKKKILWIGCGCLSILACGVLAGGLWFFGSNLKYIIASERETKNITVEITAPEHVKPGESFLIEIQVTNTSGQAQELDSIDLYHTYLKGMDVTRVDPAFVRSREITYAIESENYLSFDFKREIPANSMTKEIFHLTAREPGKYSGLVFICINNPTLCDRYSIQTIVDN